MKTYPLGIDLDGEIKTLQEIANNHGLAFGTFDSRCRLEHPQNFKTGNTIKITEHLVRSAQERHGRTYTVDGVEYPSSIAAWLANRWLRNPDQLRNKCRSLGTYNVTKEQVLERKKTVIKNPRTRKPRKDESLKERDIPASWQGLSATKNTGAGRGEFDLNPMHFMDRTAQVRAHVNVQVCE